MIEEFSNTTTSPSLNPIAVIILMVIIAYVYHHWPTYEHKMKASVKKIGNTVKAQTTDAQATIDSVHNRLGNIVQRHTNGFPKQLSTIFGKHVMIVGGTNNGKSTFKAFLAAYLRQKYPNCLIITIDPHYREKDMVPVDEVYGQGRDYKNIIEGGQHLITELNRRYEDYGNGVDEFIPTFVFVDELTAISQNTKDFRPIQHQISCEGRKVGIFLFLNTHSLQVGATGFEKMSDLYDNFTIIRVKQPNAYLEYADENGNTHKIGIKFWPVI
jgi:hypothetical protein